MQLDITPAYSWMATSRVTVNGCPGRRTTSQMPSLGTGIAMIMNSLLFVAFIFQHK
jgi:hypothetical protein